MDRYEDAKKLVNCINELKKMDILRKIKHDGICINIKLSGNNNKEIIICKSKHDNEIIYNFRTFKLDGNITNFYIKLFNHITNLQIEWCAEKCKLKYKQNNFFSKLKRVLGNTDAIYISIDIKYDYYSYII